MFKCFKVSKRPFALLEVLIAFTLLTLCAAPLLTAYVDMLKIQAEFKHRVELDHFVNQYFGLLYEQLHRNEIAWDIIEKKEPQEFNIELLNRWLEGKEPIQELRQLGVKGQYTFHIVNAKPRPIDPSKPTGYEVHLDMQFTTLKGMARPIIYSYTLFILHLPPKEVKNA